jgi:hypothetical protein
VNLVWLENLTKPFASLLNPIAERIGNWFGRRKPHLYVHFNINQTVWGIAQQGQRNGSSTEMMQVVFWADFNHDDPKETLIITDAYPCGTRPQIGMMDSFAVPPKQVVHHQIAAFVLPIKADKGKPWSGQFILIDQFQRKHRTKKITFQWVG